MITRNFENLLASILEASDANTYSTHFPIIDVWGETKFISGNFYSYSFPNSITSTPTLSQTSAGISVGTDDTPESKFDINLKNTITSGITITAITSAIGCKATDTCYKDYTVTITNNGSSAITIREIGYKQLIDAVRYIDFNGNSSLSSTACLLDRTVLNPPITIQAGDAGVILYRLKTVQQPRYKNGVKLVSFMNGSDEEIAAMIDAAHQGLIDLQTDGEWCVGDARLITLSAFTGGGNTAHASQQKEIVISEFGDYNNCGCLFQFDFMNCLNEVQRMSATDTNVGGYSATEMYTTTLPAMVEALPEWLRTRLKSFDVLVSAGNKSSTIETIGNNKLALRSEIELCNTTNKSFPGEGTLINRYKYSRTRQKYLSRTGNSTYWWLRSPDKSSTWYFDEFSSGSGTSSANPSSSYGLSPFGCL